MTIALKQDALDRLWPEAVHSLTEGMVATSATVFAKYGITTFAEARDFMAQSSSECAAGTDIEENLNYSAKRLCQVWPARFKSIGGASPYAHNPRALADFVYGGRMGNLAGTDDGWNYRGRGPIQLTGHDNYASVGKAIGVDLVSSPDIVNGPAFLECGVAFWRLAGLNVYADKGDFRGETLRINGGYADLSARTLWRSRWTSDCFVTTATPPVSPSPQPVTKPDVRTIVGIQTALKQLGFNVSIDNDYGPQTRIAVEDFQRSAGIVSDGICGAQTEAALLKALGQLS